jgi:hypothetical protein
VFLCIIIFIYVAAGGACVDAVLVYVFIKSKMIYKRT